MAGLARRVRKRPWGLPRACTCPARQHWPCNPVLTALHLYYNPVISTVGLLGNTLCIVVLVDNVLCHLSTTHYLIGIAVADSLVLFYQFHQWLTYYKITFYKLGGWCQFITFVKSSSEFLSLWFFVSYVTDRFIGLYFPAREESMCTPTRAKIVLIALTIVAIVVYLNISIMVGLVPYGQDLFCTTLGMFFDTEQRLEKGHVFVNSFLPMTALVVILAIITWKLCTQRGADRSVGLSMNMRDTQCNYAARRQSRPANETSIRVNQTKPFLTVLIAYLLMNLPYEGLKFVHTVKTIHYKTSITIEPLLWEQIFLYLKYTNCSVNLLLLVLSYASFRKRARTLPSRLKKLCKWGTSTEETQSMTSAAALEAGTETTGVSSSVIAES